MPKTYLPFNLKDFYDGKPAKHLWSGKSVSRIKEVEVRAENDNERQFAVFYADEPKKMHAKSYGELTEFLRMVEEEKPKTIIRYFSVHAGGLSLPVLSLADAERYRGPFGIGKIVKLVLEFDKESDTWKVSNGQY